MSEFVEWTVASLSRSQLPTFVDEGGVRPDEGWVVEAFSRVIKDGEPAGIFGGCSIGPDGRTALTYGRVADRPA